MVFRALAADHSIWRSNRFATVELNVAVAAGVEPPGTAATVTVEVDGKNSIAANPATVPVEPVLRTLKKLCWLLTPGLAVTAEAPSDALASATKHHI